MNVEKEAFSVGNRFFCVDIRYVWRRKSGNISKKHLTEAGKYTNPEAVDL